MFAHPIMCYTLNLNGRPDLQLVYFVRQLS